MNPKFKAFIIATLRKGTYRWSARNEALSKARVERGLYKCNVCGGIYKKKEINIDHIKPVVDPETGFVDWNTYIPRMFPEVDGFQILCITCHDQKTLLEKHLRLDNKKKK